MVAAQAEHAEASAALAATASSAAADLQAMLAAERQAGGGIGNGSAATGVAEQASSLIQQAARLQDVLPECCNTAETATRPQMQVTSVLVAEIRLSTCALVCCAKL